MLVWHHPSDRWRDVRLRLYPLLRTPERSTRSLFAISRRNAAFSFTQAAGLARTRSRAATVPACHDLFSYRRGERDPSSLIHSCFSFTVSPSMLKTSSSSTRRTPSRSDPRSAPATAVSLPLLCSVRPGYACAGMIPGYYTCAACTSQSAAPLSEPSSSGAALAGAKLGSQFPTASLTTAA